MNLWFPKRPQTLEEAKLKPYFVRESILKILYTRGVTRGIELCNTLKLPFALIEPELRHLRENDCLAPVGGAGIGGYDGMDFGLTQEGRTQASSILERTPYVGPSPVDIADYFESVHEQKFVSRWVKKQHIQAAFTDIVLDSKNLKQLGPAINSGGPLFLYGKPGNGKTTISERLGKIFKQGVFVPFAIQTDGQIIQFLDEKVHKRIPVDKLPDDHPAKADPRSIDSRWAYVFRPFIIVGGELTLEMLDLTYREGQASYEAPFQLKANCGVLLVDDFGRQIVKPKDFLNRWIYPLEKNTDFLTLENGRKIEVPFEQILIFSTNLDPKDLGDEAFWRRIPYKIEIPSPNEADFKSIFQAVCIKKKVPFDEASFKYLVDKYYKTSKRDFRAVHPRDILNHVVDYILYNGLETKLTPDVIDNAVEPYFANVGFSPDKQWAKAS